MGGGQGRGRGGREAEGGGEGRKGWVGGPLCEILNTPLFILDDVKLAEPQKQF